MYSILALPYTPNPTLKKKMGRPLKHCYRHRIAYTETMRGLQDDVPTLLFLGAPFPLLKETCQYLYKLMDGKVKNLTVSWEHSCRVRNGKHYWRIAVGIMGLDEQSLSLQEFTLLIVAYMKRVCHCTVRHFRTETFLNL